MQSRNTVSQSQWPRGLRRGSAAARLLGSRVLIPSWACECCALWCRGLCVGPIARLEESYRVRCVWLWYRNSPMRRPTMAVESWQEMIYCDCQQDLRKATHRGSGKCCRYSRWLLCADRLKCSRWLLCADRLKCSGWLLCADRLKLQSICKFAKQISLTMTSRKIETYCKGEKRLSFEA